MNDLSDKLKKTTFIYQLYLFLSVCFVSIKGCKRSGVYGTDCDVPCHATCKNNTCHILSGACLECEPGVYGSYCNLSCPTNCKDSICHVQNGTCLTCKPGWTGMYCRTSKNNYHSCQQYIINAIIYFFQLL